MNLKKISAYFPGECNIYVAGLWVFGLVAALFIRVYGLSDYYYSSDDAWHLVVASQETILDVIKYNFVQEVHPPLSYIIWHLMLKISHNELWIRSFSIIPSILLIPSIYLFGRLYIGRAGAYAMAIAMAYGALPVDISVAVRAYCMMMLALTWAGIFIYKYQQLGRHKYLAAYFVLALIALGLNHGAAFLIFAFGLMLMAHAYSVKSWRQMALIAALHLVLAGFTVGYGYILQQIWQGRQLCYFSIFFSTLEFFIENILLLIANVSSFFYYDLNIFSLLSCYLMLLFSVIFLVKDRRFLLLNIAITPIITVFFTEYFRLYPFSSNFRNNLFMFLSFLVMFGYFSQVVYNYFAAIKNFPNAKLTELFRLKSIGIMQAFYIFLYWKLSDYFVLKSRVLYAKIILIILLLAVLIYSVAISDFYQHKQPLVEEVELTKADFAKSFYYLDKYNTKGNIFVTDMEMIWHFMLIDGNKGKTTYITENLALYQNDKYKIYFTAFPGIYKSVTVSLYDWRIFLQDLFTELQNSGKEALVANVIYFRFGYFQGVNKAIYPSFIPEKQQIGKNSPAKEFYDKSNKFNKESYDFSWAIQTSDQIAFKLAFADMRTKKSAVIFLGMTPKFIKDNILHKEFVDIVNVRKEAVFGKSYNK